MRMLMTVEVPTEAGNQAIRDGALPKALETVLADVQAEAAYFGPKAGHRAAFIVFDLDDPSRIPSICEPLFQQLSAKVELMPVMSREDLAKGLSQLQP